MRYYIFVKSRFNILVRNASPTGPMCFRCLIFNLSGPCELLFLLCFYCLVKQFAMYLGVVAILLLCVVVLCL